MLGFRCPQLSRPASPQMAEGPDQSQSSKIWTSCRPKDKPLPDRAAHAVSFYQLTARQRLGCSLRHNLLVVSRYASNGQSRKAADEPWRGKRLLSQSRGQQAGAKRAESAEDWRFSTGNAALKHARNAYSSNHQQRLPHDAVAPRTLQPYWKNLAAWPCLGFGLVQQLLSFRAAVLCHSEFQACKNPVVQCSPPLLDVGQASTM